ncbi:hypothetical protein BN000_02002 [Neobacillus massiliamazoniensis]|uniref:Uncharacterized protein n=1 Tax=Neobacillus massiliamazoniensis TaxID=1499688 RepID=A0A0U1NVM8_9BACI|nr:hypothetical protein BN000_02002 [Neobacillus massiliamazoniensis]
MKEYEKANEKIKKSSKQSQAEVTLKSKNNVKGDDRL